MGYTHYWRQKRPFTQTEWDQITEQARAICARASDQKIKFVAHFNDDYIDVDGGYEPMNLERNPVIRTDPGYDDGNGPESFTFCKTNYLPYDAIVVSILQIARTVAPDAIRVSSDGGDEAIKLAL